MVTATSSDGRVVAVTDDANAGVLLNLDFDDLAPLPVQVTVERDGIRVRSGDPAWAPGGYAVAYDHEAPLGVSASWRARPVYADGTTGAWSASATLTVPAMPPIVDNNSGFDCWIKPLDNPGGAVALRLNGQPVEESVTHRVQVDAVQNRALPAGRWDRRSPAPLSMTLRTTTKAEKDRLAAALDLGPVLVQLRSLYGIDDFYALPTDETRRYLVGMHSPLRNAQLTFQPVDRYPTVDSPLRIPGRSYADSKAAYATYSARLAAHATYAAALGV